MDKLKKFRNQIDSIDHELLETLAKRFCLGREIAKYKKEKNLPREDLEREVNLIKDRLARFKELGFEDEIFIVSLFKIILKKSKNL